METTLSDILKGNFKTKNPVNARTQKDKTLEEQFEKEALKRLGGSIAFVSKRKVMWDTSEKQKPSGKDK
jgi:hypothetical protein